MKTIFSKSAGKQLLAGLLAGVSCAALAFDMDVCLTGPNPDAAAVCQDACKLNFDGGWVTTEEGSMSICHARNKLEQSIDGGIEAGPIWNNGEAKAKCDIALNKVAAVGQVLIAEGGKTAVCNCSGGKLRTWTPNVIEPVHHWTYEGTEGPEHWGDIEGYGTCKTGTAQSPINIVTTTNPPLPSTFGNISFSYDQALMRVMDNGHTILLDVDPGSCSGTSNSIQFNNKSYKFLQVHFHTPSEEKINGKTSSLVAHLVHKSADGELAVVAVLFNTGAENSIVKKVWNNIPPKDEKSRVTLNLADMLPAMRSYYNFKGSLTTPPCTENVNWLVLNHAMTVSDEQLARFRQIYPENARPEQSSNGRAVYMGGQ